MSEAGKDIPNAEIEQDIADTEREIAIMRQEIAALDLPALCFWAYVVRSAWDWHQYCREQRRSELIPSGSTEFRMAQFRISARRDCIERREKFIVKLRDIIARRKSCP